MIDQYWQDIIDDKIYKIDKLTGVKKQINRACKHKSTYNNQITGKVGYRYRVQNSKEQNLPRIPLYLYNRSKIFKKYQQFLKESDPNQKQIIYKKRSSDIQKIAIHSSQQIQFPVSNQIEQQIRKQRCNRRRQFLSRNRQIFDYKDEVIQQIKSNQQNDEFPKQMKSQEYDSKQFFTTKYATKKKSLQNIYFSPINPEKIDDIKVVTKNQSNLINKTMIQKKQLIQILEKRTKPPPEKLKIIKLRTEPKDREIMKQIQQHRQKQLHQLKRKNRKINFSSHILDQKNQQLDRKLHVRRKRLWIQKLMLNLNNINEKKKFDVLISRELK